MSKESKNYKIGYQHGYERGREEAERAHVLARSAGSVFPFWCVNVTTKGSEGTINLMWKEWPIQWINNKEMAKEIREFLDSQNKQFTELAENE